MNREIDKLIDRIPKENKFMVTTEELVNYILMLENKIERLNNIINELEKWLEDNIEYGDDDYYDMKSMGVESALKKLQELKENK